MVAVCPNINSILKNFKALRNESFFLLSSVQENRLQGFFVKTVFDVVVHQVINPEIIDFPMQAASNFMQ